MRLAQVAISFNKRTYRFQCGEDEAERLEQLANYLKTKLDSLMQEHRAIGDERLVLMAALTLADELFDARADIDELLEDQTGKLKEVASQSTSQRPSSGSSGASDDGERKVSR
ncbi:MAG TPA: cell division protein ZapA [Hyphomicrobium sp.]|nr:cell division protein ZapA [Hyphomicrobium sp.]